MIKIGRKTASNLTRSLTSAVFGGVSAFFFGPLLWLGLIFLNDGEFSSAAFAGLIAVALFATIAGLVFAVFVGFPILALFNRFGLHRPIFIILAASLASVLVFSRFLSLPLSAWPLYVYMCVLGALCGAVSAWHNAPVSSQSLKIPEHA